MGLPCTHSNSSKSKFTPILISQNLFWKTKISLLIKRMGERIWDSKITLFFLWNMGFFNLFDREMEASLLGGRVSMSTSKLDNVTNNLGHFLCNVDICEISPWDIAPCEMWSFWNKPIFHLASDKPNQFWQQNTIIIFSHISYSVAAAFWKSFNR